MNSLGLTPWKCYFTFAIKREAVEFLGHPYLIAFVFEFF